MATCRAQDPSTCRVHGTPQGQAFIAANDAYGRLGYPKHHPMTKAAYERKREQLRNIDRTDLDAVRRGKRIRGDLKRFWVAAAVTHILSQEHGRSRMLNVSKIEVDDLKSTGSVRVVLGRSHMYYIKKSDLYSKA